MNKRVRELKNHIVLKLTPKEAGVLSLMIENSYGNGDFEDLLESSSEKKACHSVLEMVGKAGAFSARKRSK